jgi:hypothetical protein
MKYKILALLIFIPLIYWQLDSALVKVEQHQHSKKTNKQTTSSRTHRPSMNHRIHSNSETSRLARAQNEILAHMLPISFEDFGSEDLSDQENGAFYLKKALALLDNKDNSSAITEFQKLSKKDYSQLTLKEKEQLQKWLADPSLNDIFSALTEAASQDKFDWKLDYSQGFATLLPHVSDFRNLHEMQILKMNSLRESGDTQAALDSLKIGLKTATMGSDSKTIISELVQIASLKKYFTNIQNQAYNKDVYQILQNELYTSFDRQLNTVDAERILGNEFAFEKFQTMSMQQITDIAGEDYKDSLTNLTPEMIERDQSYYLENMLKIRLLMEDNNSQTMPELVKLNKDLTENKYEYPLTSLLMPSYTNLIKKYQGYQTSLKMNLLSLKLKEFRENQGNYPDSLDQLSVDKDLFLDTLSETNFTYTKKDDQITLEPITDFGKDNKGMKIFLK